MTDVNLTEQSTGTANLTRSLLVERMQERLIKETGRRINRNDVRILLNGALEEIKDVLAAGGRVRLDRFGTFVTRHYAATTRINPQKPTERITVAERSYPAFKPGKELKSRVKSAV